MKLKVLGLMFCLLAAVEAHAAAPVEEREIKRGGIETAQQKADFARKQARDAEQRLRLAEEELSEANSADQVARKRAAETASRLEQAKAGVEHARIDRDAANASFAERVQAVGNEWESRRSQQ